MVTEKEISNAFAKYMYEFRSLELSIDQLAHIFEYCYEEARQYALYQDSESRKLLGGQVERYFAIRPQKRSTKA